MDRLARHRPATEATLLFRVQGGFLGFQLGNHLLGSVVEVLIQDLFGDAAIALDRLVNFHAPFAHGIRAPMQRPRCRPAIYVKTPLRRFCSFPLTIQIGHKRLKQASTQAPRRPYCFTIFKWADLQDLVSRAGRSGSFRYSRYGVSTPSIHFMNARTRRDRLLRCATTRDTGSARRRKSGRISTSAQLSKYRPIPKSGA